MGWPRELTRPSGRVRARRVLNGQYAIQTVSGIRGAQGPIEEDGVRGRASSGGKDHLRAGILGSNASTEHPAYLNWDDPAVREPFMHGRIPVNQPLLLLDEIHKYARWRNLVKGLFDTHRTRLSILVTGSARLDYYACARTDRSLQPICSSERSRLQAPRRSTRCRAAS